MPWSAIDNTEACLEMSLEMPQGWKVFEPPFGLIPDHKAWEQILKQTMLWLPKSPTALLHSLLQRKKPHGTSVPGISNCCLDSWTRSVLLVSTLGFKCVLVLQAHVLHSIAECPSNWFPQLAENALALPSALRHGLLACYSALCIPRCGVSKTRMARYGKVGCKCLLRLVIQFFDVLDP